jgi:pimeloyl-ACP methyl ester carboxylesterase
MTDIERELSFVADGAELGATLVLVPGAHGVVVFAHGSGSSRFSPRNRAVATVLEEAGFSTALIDLLSSDEEDVDRATGELRFDIGLLSGRLLAATDRIAEEREAAPLRVAYFGASTGAAAALVAAAERPDIRAVVSRGGRPDLAGEALRRVQAPTLLIVGGDDPQVLELNEAARKELPARTELAVVPGATHLFEEPGALDEVARLSREWLLRHLAH